MKLISWNVNGIRAALKHGAMDFIREAEPDILCLQETKAMPDQVNVDLPDYHAFWACAEKKGYSGTAVFTRVEPLDVRLGLGIEKHDREGRVVTLEFQDYFLVNVYTPNSKRELLRLDYRTGEWDVDFLKYVRKLEKKKPVIFCGDLNVCHKEIDIANPKSNRRNAGFTDEERAGFDRMIDAEFIDTFREFTAEGGHYTWWSYRGRAREKNIGWRLDYFLISKALRPRLRNSTIHPHVIASDHCPVEMILE